MTMPGVCDLAPLGTIGPAIVAAIGGGPRQASGFGTAAPAFSHQGRDRCMTKPDITVGFTSDNVFYVKFERFYPQPVKRP